MFEHLKGNTVWGNFFIVGAIGVRRGNGICLPGNWDTNQMSRFNSCNDSLFSGMTLTLHKSQIYCSGIMTIWAVKSHSPAIAIFQNIAKTLKQSEPI